MYVKFPFGHSSNVNVNYNVVVMNVFAVVTVNTWFYYMENILLCSDWLLGHLWLSPTGNADYRCRPAYRTVFIHLIPKAWSEHGVEAL